MGVGGGREGREGEGCNMVWCGIVWYEREGRGREGG